MAVREVLIDPDPRLREVCPPVEVFDDAFRERMADLIDTFQENQWIGLSAPQLGLLERVLVIDVSENRDAMEVFVNPEVLQASRQAIVEESCASVPGVEGKVMRATRLHVRAQDLNGQYFDAALNDMRAVCLQHELDHLDGKLFVDRLPFWRRWRRKLSAG